MSVEIVRVLGLEISDEMVIEILHVITYISYISHVSVASLHK
jgi:hypothetical protein